jgi:hypothetical protein
MEIPDAKKYTIARDWDSHGVISADADPLVEYLIYLGGVRSDGLGDMGFTLADFGRDIAIREPNMSWSHSRLRLVFVEKSGAAWA